MINKDGCQLPKNKLTTTLLYYLIALTDQMLVAHQTT